MSADPADGREYPTRPWVGVGVIVFRGDEILLIKRGRPPGLGEWGIPGGAQNLGETVFEAAEREVREETGVRITQVDYHSSQPWPFPSSLMLGFHAIAAANATIRVGGELADASLEQVLDVG